MKQIAQNYKNGELSLLSVPVPACRPGGVLVRTAFSLISAGTELMKVSESKLSLLGKARARPDQVKKVLSSVSQQGLRATYKKVMNRLDSYTPLGYSLSGIVVEVGEGVDEFQIGQAVACAGNQFAFHAEYNWAPLNMCVPVPQGVGLDQAAFATVGAIALHGMHQGEIAMGETAFVVGLGLLGQIAVRLLHGAGVSVFGCDLVPERCRLAEAGGAVACAVPHSPEFDTLRSRLSELTGGHGADCVFITASGNGSAAVELAAMMARDRGRVVDIGKCGLDLPYNAYYEKELSLRFSRSYGPGRYDPLYEEGGVDYPIGYVRWTERRNMACVIGLLAAGRVDFSSLISQVHPFDAAVDVYEKMNKGEISGLGVLFRYPGDQGLDRRIPGKAAAAPRASAIRLGVIGAGNYASSMLLPHLAANPDVRLVEVATNTALSAANGVKKFGFARQSTDVAGLLTAEDVDAVVIATRHASHARLVCAALKTGKAVFVEKPLAVDEEGLAQIAQVAAETGNDRLMVGFNRRFAPMLTQLKQLWGPRAGRHVLDYRVNAGQLDKGSWVADSINEGSRFVGEGCHFVDTVSWWLGADPVQVSAASTRGDGDNLLVTLTYPDGSIANIGYFTQGDSRYPKERLEIFGQGWVASFDNFRRFELWRGGKSKSVRSHSVDKGQGAEMSAFVEAVKSGGPMPVAFESLVATTAATLAAQRSVLTNRTVAIEQPGAAAMPLFERATG